MTSNTNHPIQAQSDFPSSGAKRPSPYGGERGERLSIYDFDGTLTVKDSMMEIITFHCGRLRLLWALLRQMHLIVLMLLGMYDNQKCKEHLLAYCFGGMTEEEFDAMCQHFADTHAHIIRTPLMEQLRRDASEGIATYVISASPERWVSKFVPGVTVLASKMEIVDGKITGRLRNRNCYGQEKVNRLLAAHPDLKEHRADYHITAYGDSKGDREMFAFADESHLIK